MKEANTDAELDTSFMEVIDVSDYSAARKPTLESREKFISELISYHVLLKNKAMVDQFIDGLKCYDVSIKVENKPDNSYRDIHVYIIFQIC